MPEDGAETKDQGHAPLSKVHRSASNDSTTELYQKDLEQNGEEHNAEKPFVVVSPVEPESSLWYVFDPSVCNSVVDFSLIEDSRIEHVENVHEDDSVEDYRVHSEFTSCFT